MTATAENTGTRKPSAKVEKVKVALSKTTKAGSKKAVKVSGTSLVKTPTLKAKATPLREEYPAYASPSSHTHQPMVSVLLPGTDTDDPMAVFRATKAGFPLGSVVDLVESVDAFKHNNVLSKIVGLSDRTLARRMKKRDESLTPEQSARALYYAQVLERAQEVFGSRALAEEWMTQPALGLDGESPIDLLSNPVGYELVADFLHRLEFGVY